MQTIEADLSLWTLRHDAGREWFYVRARSPEEAVSDVRDTLGIEARCQKGGPSAEDVMMGGRNEDVWQAFKRFEREGRSGVIAQLSDDRIAR